MWVRTHTQTVNGNKPDYIQAGFNFHPTLFFDGEDALTTASFGSGDEAMHLFAMTSRGVGWSTVYGIRRDLVHPQWRVGRPSVYISGNLDYPTDLGFNFGVVSWMLPKQSLQRRIGWNGDHRNIATTNNYTFNATLMGVGSDLSDAGALSESFNGNISELIIYKTGTPSSQGGNLDPVLISKIETYLAVKYGVTLFNNFIASDGTIIYNVADGFGNRVFGIARDDVQSLNQKVSNSIHDGAILTLGAANTLSSSNAAHPGGLMDNTYLLIGDNNLTGLETVTGSGDCPPPPLVDNLTNRIWKVTNTGNVGSVRIRANLSGFGFNGNFTAYMQVSSDPSFTTYSFLPMSPQGAGAYEMNYLFPSGNTYFRFGGSVGAPDPVCTDNKVFNWHKPRWVGNTNTRILTNPDQNVTVTISDPMGNIYAPSYYPRSYADRGGHVYIPAATRSPVPN
jgi:hypothetical protein